MIEIPGRVSEARADVFTFQVGVVDEDLILSRPGGQHVQNVFDADAHVANARPTAAFAGLDRDSRRRGGRRQTDILRRFDVSRPSHDAPIRYSR